MNKYQINYKNGNTRIMNAYYVEPTDGGWIVCSKPFFPGIAELNVFHDEYIESITEVK